jgi:hypothetical protein
MRRRIILIVGAAALVGVVVFVPFDTMWLHRGVEGPQCLVPENTEGMDFRSGFNSENQFVNGSTIRSLSGDPSPECSKIGGTYRCGIPAATTVEIRLFDIVYHYSAPAGAIVYGDQIFADCFVPLGVGVGVGG